MISVGSYMLVFARERRRELLAEAVGEVSRAKSGLAELYAAEAMIRLQEHYPQAIAVEFRSAEEADGLTVTIVKVKGANRATLYAESSDFPYFDDQSDVGDMLVAALEADRRVFAGREGRHILTWSA